MNSNSLGFAQALTLGSKKIVGSIKYQCFFSVGCLGVRVQYLDGFAGQNTLCRSGLSKSPWGQDLHSFCVNFGEEEIASPARTHFLTGSSSPGTFLTVRLLEGLIF